MKVDLPGTQTWSLCGQRSCTPLSQNRRTWMSVGRTGNMPVFPSPALPNCQLTKTTSPDGTSSFLLALDNGARS